MRLKLQPHRFASGLSGLAGTAELREEQPGSPAPRAPCSWALGTCQGLCTMELVPSPCSHIPVTWAASIWSRPQGASRAAYGQQGTLGAPIALSVAEDS